METLVNGDPIQYVRDKIASMSMTERSQAKLGYRESFGSKIVVYGVCAKCHKDRCEYACNGTLRCFDFHG